MYAYISSQFLIVLLTFVVSVGNYVASAFTKNLVSLWFLYCFALSRVFKPLLFLELYCHLFFADLAAYL